MNGFVSRAFCARCGAHCGRMPNSRFRSGPPPTARRCVSCRAGSAWIVVREARRGRVGRWPWQRGWVGKAGQTVPEPLGNEQLGRNDDFERMLRGEITSEAYVIGLRLKTQRNWLGSAAAC